MGSDKNHTKIRAVFLDRDGTLNLDPGYLNDFNRLELLPGVLEALSQLQSAGLHLIVISNQSGVGRGLITIAQIQKIHEHLDHLLSKHGIKILAYQLCFHRPEEDCACRKPKPFLIHDAASRFQIDIASSFMVGDKCSDVECGKNAGCQASVLVSTGEGSNEFSRCPDVPDYVASDLKDASDWILSQLDFS